MLPDHRQDPPREESSDKEQRTPKARELPEHQHEVPSKKISSVNGQSVPQVVENPQPDDHRPAPRDNEATMRQDGPRDRIPPHKNSQPFLIKAQDPHKNSQPMLTKAQAPHKNSQPVLTEAQGPGKKEGNPRTNPPTPQIKVNDAPQAIKDQGGRQIPTKIPTRQTPWRRQPKPKIAIQTNHKKIKDLQFPSPQRTRIR